ncbi:MAG: hypothetical protein GXP62_09895 [Oligoflexia bacterium]|nr:hypothetical protein [Oligoflexia bacterium]
MVLLLLLACQSSGPPAWGALNTVYLDPDGQGVILDAGAWLADRGDGRPYISVQAAGGLLAQIRGSDLSLLPALDFQGSTSVALTVTDRQGRLDTATLPVVVGTAACPVTLRRDPAGGDAVSAVRLDGDIVDAVVDPALTQNDDGSWSIDLDLAPGSYPYRFVETVSFSQGDQASTWCDPDAAQILCPAGYINPGDTTWSYDCTVPDPSCDSLLIVPDCTLPQLTVSKLAVDRSAGTVQVDVDAAMGVGAVAITQASASLDGQPIDAWDGKAFHVEQSGLSAGRHTLRFDVTDADGNTSDQAWVPLWTDFDPDSSWRAGSIYYAFTDRLVNSDADNDGAEGASADLGDYMGGDWAGTQALLPYLDDLGVRTLWISNPQDNADGAWPGSCDLDFAGYHAYWPVSGRDVEPHFGSDQDLRDLISAAHARGMRIVMDWVGNHVHQDHPYAIDHPEWFNPQDLCEDYTGSEQNWTALPETCWFASYLPDLDYTRADVMDTMLDDAMWWARTYDLDGFRVDAAKHMSHAVQWNLQHRVQEQIEYPDAGGDTQFWTVGETFDGADQIAAYIGPDQLDGQFDFPLYWAIRGALGSRSTSLSDLWATLSDSASRYDGALMSVFLGNHDVPRFTTELSEGDTDICDGTPLAQASGPWDDWSYQGLQLAWTLVLTRPDVPMIYYGDEIGMPGYGDPDNRQPLWWYLDAVPASVEDALKMVDDQRGAVLRTVAALGQARRQHPAMYSGIETQWWISDDVLAYARTTGDDHVLVVLNPGDSEQWLTNGLSFASLPTDGVWTDVITGETVTAANDQITVTVPARSARVLVSGGR